MQTSENLGPLERRIEMTVPMAEVDKDVDERLKKLARTVRMAGFRPGKVPLKVVAQQYGPQMRSEALGEALSRAFGAAVSEQKLRVAGQPRIEAQSTGDESSMAFSAVFEVYPEIVLGDVSDREVERPQLVVGDAEVDRTIEVLRKQRTVFEIAHRPAQESDRVTIDFTGRRDGEIFEGGQASDYPVMLGSGAMLPQFESQLAGLAAGESRTFDMTFPEDYHAPHLAGQQVQFEVSVKKVEAPRLPEVDGDFARSLGVGDGDITRMREEVKANLEREVRKRIQARLKEQVMEALLATHPLEVPKTLVDEEAGQLAENARADLARRGIDVKQVPVDGSWFADQALRRVKLGLIVAEIVKQNHLEAKPEQVRALIDEFAQSYEDPKDVVRWYYEQPQRLADLQGMVLENNVVEWFLANARPVDKPVAFEELMETAA
ncbi:MAG: trigger factor [Betaproteobacteria bacterium]|nr:trigger factor [Betaproteobacteria bacterium]